MQTVNFDYFYGDESEQFSYYRIPRLLVTGAQFKNLSTDSKLLYGLMLDRMGLSMKNHWYDHRGRVYIHYTLDEIQAALNCGHNKGVRLLAELDTVTGIGLIERVKQGQGHPTRIYVKRFTAKVIPQQPIPPHDDDDFRLPKSGSQEFPLRSRWFSALRSSSTCLSSFGGLPFLVPLAAQALPRLSFIRPSAPSSRNMRSHLRSIFLAPPD